ncbi:MAG: ABC transporter permease [Methylocystis sp.]|nr:ABC transporter permease [Methylocystis sp.]MCA3582366.1 ABC transporter permease [Methylocystis sp.]MCA3588261.1 ABC transporter permease [Methylocystis sp.]MCA3590179.1 ABC transporter permease [Methylocystis sp.]
MFGYLIRSVLQAIVVMLAVAFIAFSMFRFVGDPVASIVGQDATLKDRQELADSLGLNDPLLVQFARFVGNAAQGDFGISYRQGRPVATLLRERLPATIELAVISAALALVLGLGLGIYTALRRDGWAANLVMSLSLIGVSLPTFLIGIGLIYFFGVVLRWLPTFGRGETVAFGWWTTGLLTESGRKSLILPVVTLGFYQLTLIMRLVRSEMLEVMRADYIRFARARGLTDGAINFKHALKNTMIPVVTITGLQLGSIVAFAITTETVFNWPGLGALFVKSVEVVDIPVMGAYLMFVGLIFVVVSLIVDMLYFLIDPRLRTGGAVPAK